MGKRERDVLSGRILLAQKYDQVVQISKKIYDSLMNSFKFDYRKRQVEPNIMIDEVCIFYTKTECKY